MARAIRCTTPSGAGRCPTKSIIPATPHMISLDYVTILTILRGGLLTRASWNEKNFLQSMMPPASQRTPKEKSGEMSADQRS
jgi:hypothetical protein